MNVIKRFALAIALVFSIGVVADQCHAGLTRFPGGVSSYGVPVLPGVGSNMFADVNVFWVDSQDSSSADGAGGGKAKQPFKTIDFAIGQCTANNGDLILVKPGHIETVTAAGGLDFDVAGITIIGIGNGGDRPVVRFTTATTADADFDAANVKIINILFEARFDKLAAPLDVNAADVSLLNIETRDISAFGSATNFIVADANADRLYIDGWKHIGTTTNAGASDPSPVSALQLTGGDDIIVRNANLYGNFAMSGILATVTGCTRLTIGGHDQHTQIWTENSTDSAIDVGWESTGWVGPNIACRLQDDAANITEAYSGSTMQFITPLMIVNADGEKSTNTNITASTD